MTYAKARLEHTRRHDKVGEHERRHAERQQDRLASVCIVRKQVLMGKDSLERTNGRLKQVVVPLHSPG